MMTRRPILSAIGAVGALFGARADADERIALDGVWTGALEVGPERLRLQFEFGADGAGTLKSLDQGGAPMPVRVSSSSSRRIVIEVPPVRGRFEGAATQDGRLVGVWRQGGSALPLVLLRGEAGLAAASPAAPLDAALLRTLRATAGSPALVAAAARRGGDARYWSVGEREAGSGVGVTDNDRWHVGSITKSMTATLVARLVESDAVRWDDTVGDVLADVAPEMRADYRAVELRHLLSHRSGLPANLPVFDLMAFSRVSVDPREERKAYARKALAMAPKGAPGAVFEYANNGYVVAGAMLEAKLGQPWEHLVLTHVFAPLGMTGVGFGAPGARGRIDQPAGHSKALLGDRRNSHPPGSAITDNPAVLGPAGTAHASAADMLRYLDAHRDGVSFLKPESWRTLHTPPFGGDYAMGWVVRPDGTLWHNGSNTLWYAEATFDPAKGVSAFAAANDGHLATSQIAVGKALRGAVAAA
jgi:CubicO group peptidase (beta-lactamase class C family)